MAARTKSSSKKSSGLIGALEPYFTTNAPFQIPASARKFIVTWIPWVNLVVGIIFVMAFLPLLGLGAVVSVVAASYAAPVGGLLWISIFVLLAQGIVMLVAFPGLKRQALSAWKLLFWADILYFAYNVIVALSNPSGMVGSLIGAVIGIAIGLYILFQVKPAYK